MPAFEIFTEHLTLGPLLSGDAAALFEYRSKPEVARYQSWSPGSVDDALLFIQGLESVAFNTQGTWYQLGIRLRQGGLLVGDLGVHFPQDEPRQAEIGVTIAPNHQRHGFATEAVTRVLGCLFGDLEKHRVFASVDPRNDGSIALLERVGMRQEAHLRESLWFKGEWVDDLVFAVLQSEWKLRA